MTRQLTKRIRAHAALCFMALLLHNVMRTRLRANDSPLSVERPMESLKRIQRQRVTIDERRLTGITTLSPKQRRLFDHLGVSQPTESSL